MNKSIQTLIFGITIIGSFITNTLSVVANPDYLVPAIFQSSTQNTTTKVSTSNSLNDTLVATVTQNLQFDIGKNQPQRINLILVQPFNNFPAGSYLRAIVNPTEDGNAILIAEVLYGNNETLAIDAESEVIYGQTVTVSNSSQEALKRTASIAPLGGLIATATGEDVEDIIQITAIAGTVGYTTGLLSPQKVQLLDLPANTPIFFTVKNN